MSPPYLEQAPEGIAIIGMAGRFPGAASVEELWRNLRQGLESISFFSEQEALEAGERPEVIARPDHVRAGGALQGSDLFDAAFFGVSPREAEILDPQQRVFLECAWEALENAAYDPRRCQESVGVFAATGIGTYLLVNLVSRGEIFESMGFEPVRLANRLDNLATRVSYKLDLRGPSVTVQTGCSSSLVAVHLACQSLLNGESDLALAGGVRVSSVQKRGYLYREAGIQSPDGRCRPFDAKAQGTVTGDGVGIVVLRRLEDALRDGDSIRAVLRGSAVNNDGSHKAGYTAPGAAGQARVIAEALAVAGVDPEEVAYVEAHGTGTILGDPVEVSALERAFRAGGSGRRGWCALGSIKGNIGHLDTASGIAGLIKTVLALEHRQIPPSLHFETPNPRIDFDRSPFYVNAKLADWPAGAGPRRAGVSSFGIGGTNAHVVLEEAPAAPPAGSSREWQLLVLSARTEAALAASAALLAGHLERHTDLDLADVAWSLQVGRHAFVRRRAVVCRGRAEAVEALRRHAAAPGGSEAAERGAVFMIPGQGAQRMGMGRDLYAAEPVFRRELDRCAELLRPHLDLDLREVLHPAEPDRETAERRLGETRLAQPALFAVSWSLARLWMEWGVQPEALIGHSLGEYVAACLAGVFSLEDVLRLVATRGRLMQALPPGAMASVALPPEELLPRLGRELSLAAVNGPVLCTVSGPPEAVEALDRVLSREGTTVRRLATSHAFHSAMMEPVLDAFAREVRGIALHAPRLRMLSSLTGTWLQDAEARDPEYWVRQLREPVRFGDGARELLREPYPALLEVGPGRTLCGLVRNHPDRSAEQAVVASLDGRDTGVPESASLLAALGRLWEAGVEVDWKGFSHGERRRRVPLPTYPFERQRYWIDPGIAPAADPARESSGARPCRPGRRPEIADWFYIPSWRRTLPPAASAAETRDAACWLVFADPCGLGERVVELLAREGRDAVAVMPGGGLARSAGGYEIDLRRSEDYAALLEALEAEGRRPTRILHLWSVTPPGQPAAADRESLERALDRSFYSLLFLAQALAHRGADPAVRIGIVSNRLHAFSGAEMVHPEKAVLLGPCKVIPRELAGASCCSIDVELPPEAVGAEDLAARLPRELESGCDDEVIAYRGVDRWLRTYAPVRLPDGDGPPPLLRRKGTYFITGGLGGVGFELARCLVQAVGARLVLVGRSIGQREGERARLQARRLEALEGMGAEVLAVAADAADEEQMAAAVARARARFGAIHGVIHAAGLPPQGLLQTRTREAAARVLAPKVWGSLVLERIFAESGLDFLALCSSRSSLIGRPGRIDYAAANAFLDEMARRTTAERGLFTVAINWAGWREAGMAADEALRREAASEDALRDEMSSTEGREVFQRILRQRVPQVVVSTQDLDALIEHHRTRSVAQVIEERERVRPAASSHPRPALRTPYVAPRTAPERIIAGIWQDLLGLDRVGVHDNFFELGGDSVISIQAIARIRREGLELTPAQVFQFQTVAELAAAAGMVSNANVEQGEVLGSHPLAPAQRWFFERVPADPWHWNQSVLLEVRRRLEPAPLAAAVGHALAHHDALRLRFVETEEGWRQIGTPPGSEIPFTALDLSRLVEDRGADWRRAVEEAAAALQASLDLARGPLLRVALFDFGAGRTGRLLVIAHHLIVDNVSWRILLEDLQAAYEQLASGGSVALPPKSTAFVHWARRLEEHARSGALAGELAHWLAEPRRRVRPLPVDVDGGANVEASVRTVAATLTGDETRALLQRATGIHRSRVDEMLLAALALTLARWSGEPLVLVEVEGHGREAVLEGLDLSRTVGWCTTFVPVLLDLKGAADPWAALGAAKEQLRQVPGNGGGYGLLRHGGGPAAEVLRLLPRPEVSFLYLGQMDQGRSGSALLAPTTEPSGPARSGGAARRRLLEVSAGIQAGELRAVWRYSEDLHRRDTVERLSEGLARTLRELAGERPRTTAAPWTPSDFPLADLGRPQLETLLERIGATGAGLDGVEDIYGLSPMQLGLVFHAIYEPDSRVYVHQIHCTLAGEIELPAMERAWQEVVDRNPILRTSFLWEGLEHPVQVVHRRALLPIERQDWRGVSPAEQEERLDEFLRRDRRRGFDLAEPPLMRVALLRIAEDAWQFVWLHHHLLLDGWSSPLVLKEVFACYEAFRHGGELRLERSRPYRDYIAWLHRQDLMAAEVAWREELRGFTQPTPLPGGRPPVGGEERHEERLVRLPAAVTEALQGLARQHQVTLASLVQAAWGLLLAHRAGLPDVVFGATVSGRVPALDGIEFMIGVFINALPVRLRIAPEEPLLPWLRRHQERQGALRGYEHAPLVQIQKWSDMPRGLPLFESILVFENFPSEIAQHGSLEVRNGRPPDKANDYPLVVAVIPGAELSLWLVYDCRRFEAAAIERTAELLERVLTFLMERPQCLLGEVLADLDLLERQRRAESEKVLESARADLFRQVKRRSLTAAGEAVEGRA